MAAETNSVNSSKIAVCGHVTKIWELISVTNVMNFPATVPILMKAYTKAGWLSMKSSGKKALKPIVKMLGCDPDTADIGKSMGHKI